MALRVRSGLQPCTCSRTTSLSRLSRRRYASATTETPLDASSSSQSTSEGTIGLLRDVQAAIKRYPLLRHAGWDGRLERASADAVNPRRARIAVVGNRESGVPSVVTAMLDNPLSSDPDFSLALETRRLKDPPEAIIIRFGEHTKAGQHEITIPSKWLEESQTDIAEIVLDDVAPQQASLDALYAADCVTFVTNETSELRSSRLRALLAEHSDRANTALIVDVSDMSQQKAIANGIARDVESSLPSGLTPRIFIVSSTQAQLGLEALVPADPNMKPSYETFQKNYTESRIPDLHAELTAATMTISLPSGEAGIPSLLQRQTASYILDKAIQEAKSEGARIEDQLFVASSDVAALSFAGEDEARKTLEGLGVVDGLMRIPSEELKESISELRHLFLSRLSWWKLFAKTDDIPIEIAIVVENTFLRHFEDRLIFDTGRLLNVSARMTERTDRLLSTSAFLPLANSSLTSPLASLYSAVLLNRLDQAGLEASQIRKSDLVAPLHKRRRQITIPGGPAEMLQSRAQSAVVSAASLSTGSIGLAVISQLTEYAELATNVGVGLFGTALAGWLLQRKWAKATKRFFVLVERRITSGLEADLGTAAHQLVVRSMHKLRTATVGAESLLKKRTADLEAFKADLSRIENRRKTLASQREKV